MDAEMWPRLAVGVLATWRLTHLLAREDGPAGLIARGRAAIGHGALGRMVDCFHCLSLWVAAPVAAWVAAAPLDAVLVWLALSGAACLCERVGQADVLVQALPEIEPGDGDGVLRTTT
jgi:hypothetical protein